MEPYELHQWSAYQFGKFEYRLIGYLRLTEGRLHCVVTEPILHVNPENGIVSVADGKAFKPIDVMDQSQKMDMMYELGKWVEMNTRGQPMECTNLIVEELKKK